MNERKKLRPGGGVGAGGGLGSVGENVAGFGAGLGGENVAGYGSGLGGENAAGYGAGFAGDNVAGHSSGLGGENVAGLGTGHSAAVSGENIARLGKRWGKGLVKWLCLAAFIAAGAFVVTDMPKAVESLLPVVNTVRMQKGSFCPTVQGSGVIYTAGEALWYVKVAVNESDVRRLEVGQNAVLNGAAFDDGAYSAAVLSISDVARQSTNGLTIETVVDVVLVIENPDEYLRSGYTAQAVIETGEARDVLLVPYEVICQDDGGEYVMVLRGNNAVRADIVTGAELAAGAELLSGLVETDEIITVPEDVLSKKLVKRAPDIAEETAQRTAQEEVQD